MLCISFLKPWVSQQYMSYISWKYITPNVVFINFESKGHQALLTDQDSSVFRSNNVTRTWVCLNLKFQLVNDILCDYILTNFSLTISLCSTHMYKSLVQPSTYKQKKKEQKKVLYNQYVRTNNYKYNSLCSYNQLTVANFFTFFEL